MIFLLVIIFLSFLVFVHEFGHFISAKLCGVKVEEFGFGFPPRIFAKQVGETKYSINLLPFGGFVKIYGENGEDLDLSVEKQDVRRGFSVQPIWKKSIMILAGVSMNILIGWFLLSMVFLIGVPEHLIVADVLKNSPAEQSGIKPQDIILEARIANLTLNDPIKSSDFVSFTKNNQGANIYLKLKRNNEIIETSALLKVLPQKTEAPLGIAVVEAGFPKQFFPKNFIEGFKDTLFYIEIIAISFYKFFTGIFISPDILNSVTGPVGIFKLAAEVGKMGLVYLLHLIAFISLNLAVLNLIPFPVLDGGRFVTILFERLRGKTISFRTQAIINGCGVLVLIILMLLVTVKDIINFF